MDQLVAYACEHPTLTAAGRAFAEREYPRSLVARLALRGYEDTDWPDTHVRAAVEACNAKGADTPPLVREVVDTLLDVPPVYPAAFTEPRHAD
jgi:hypothetical protein